MIACVDVDYRDVGAVAACVCFQSWSDGTSTSETVVQVHDVEPYQSGQFYRRELPCILAVLKSLSELPQVIVIDGYVWLGQQRPGLGAHLYEALGRSVAVIGVAKTRFVKAEAVVPVLAAEALAAVRHRRGNGRGRGGESRSDDARSASGS